MSASMRAHTAQLSSGPPMPGPCASAARVASVHPATGNVHRDRRALGTQAHAGPRPVLQGMHKRRNAGAVAYGCMRCMRVPNLGECNGIDVRGLQLGELKRLLDEAHDVLLVVHRRLARQKARAGRRDVSAGGESRLSAKTQHAMSNE